MKLKITQDVQSLAPKLLLGLVIVKNANNSRINSAIPQLIRGAVASKRRELEKLVPKARPRVEAWSKIDDKPQLLEILESVQAHDYLTFGNSLEDLGFYFSVRYEAPVITIDIDEVCGDIELTRGTGTESFRPRSTIKLEHSLQDEVIYKDKAGVVARQWGKELSQRTALTNDSHSGLFILENIGDISLEQLKILLREMERSVRTYCGGSTEIAIIGDTVTEIDLGVAGRTDINDAQYKPDPRRLAFHQKLVENFEKMKREKGAISMAVHGEQKEEQKELSEPAEPKELKEPVEPAELEASQELQELPEPHEPAELAEHQQAPELTAAQSAPELAEPEPEKSLMSARDLPAIQSKKEVSFLHHLTKKWRRFTGIAEEALPQQKILDVLQNAIQKAFPDLDFSQITVTVTEPKDASHGDYATPISMQLSKVVHQPPEEVARAIMQNWEKNEMVERITYAQPGFINIALAHGWMEKEVEKISEHIPPYHHLEIGRGKTVVLDYPSPNIAKPLGIHHILSTIIGQAIKNMYTFLGYKAISVNHIGDWGTQFGKLIVAFHKWGDRKAIEKNPIDELLKIYVKFHDEAENNPELEEEARKEFKKMEEGDKENIKLWEWFIALSLKDNQKVFDALGGITIDKIQGESFYNDKMQDILDEGKEKNIFEIGDEGALVVKFEGDKMPPFLVQKSDGATLYATRDLAALKYRVKTYKPEKIIYIVDVAQSLHFQQLFATARKLGWGGPDFVHAYFGRMRFADAKMSTRKGNILRLEEVLREAVDRAKKIVAEKTPDVNEKRCNELARIIGIGAVKYNILSQNRTTDIVFDWDKMLSLEGNSAPYLQYTCARANSILRKAANEKRQVKRAGGDRQFTLFEAIAQEEQAESATSVASGENSNHHKPSETLLMRTILKFPEVVMRASEEYRPNIIGTYLFEVAKLFNGFYHEAPVLQAETETLRAFRLGLTKAARDTVTRGLNLLGIEAPEEM